MVTPLIEQLEFFVGYELKEGQRDILAQMIVNTYPNYSINHVRMCFQRIMAGNYGSLYGQITGMNVMEMFKKFDIELDGEIISYRQRESNEHKKSNEFIKAIERGNSDVYDELCKKEFKKIKETLKFIGSAMLPKETNNNMQIKIDAEADVVQKWLREFDRLFGSKGTGRESAGIKYVFFENQWVSQMKFLKVKRDNFINT